MQEKRFSLKPYTYLQGGKEWTGAGIHDAQSTRPDLTMSMSETCALLENQHERINALVTEKAQVRTALEDIITAEDNTDLSAFTKAISRARKILKGGQS